MAKSMKYLENIMKGHEYNKNLTAQKKKRIENL